MGKDKKNKFKTPEGYFENFHDRLMDKIHSEENPQSESLIPKSDGFAVPEAYFEDITPALIAKIEAKDTKVISINSYKKYYYSIAAVAAVLLLFFGLTWNSNSEITFDDLASSEIDAYLESTEFSLSSYEIAEVVADENLELFDMLDNTLGEENIMEYLDENVEDFEDLNLDYDDYE
ncbi:hypothetical protein [Flagellimonas myxillae]|uniref:hypothetical protein n=1 Tax=Flagellimonas myxillae TaxID=2942214 RepID=UPI00201F52D6|nr:hypothetical protein [Muricauda myxillae]MCL6265548.1 hypothetical protein [Muricauda myxillae]